MSETRAPYDAGEAWPGLESVITLLIPFPDGSRIRIEIDAPAMSDAKRETDQATQAYYLHLFDRLNLIEQIPQKPAGFAQQSAGEV